VVKAKQLHRIYDLGPALINKSSRHSNGTKYMEFIQPLAKIVELMIRFCTFVVERQT
jgi:hypothetical protein